MAFTGIARYIELMKQSAIGITTGDSEHDLTLTEDRIKTEMIDFTQNENFFDDIPSLGPYLKISFPEFAGVQNLSSTSAQTTYELPCELYFSVAPQSTENSNELGYIAFDYRYILQLIDNLKNAWLDYRNFEVTEGSYPPIDDFRGGQFQAPIAVKSLIGMVSFTVTHKSVCG